MRLFQVPDGQRVRISSRLIRWVERHAEQEVAENLTWEATTTNRYFYYKGARRRLLIDHTVDFDEYGIWQRDTEVIVVAGRPGNHPVRNGSRRILIDE